MVRGALQLPMHVRQHSQDVIMNKFFENLAGAILAGLIVIATTLVLVVLFVLQVVVFLVTLPIAVVLAILA